MIVYSCFFLFYGSRELSFVYCVEAWNSSTAREWFAFVTFTLVFVIPGATMAAAYCRIGVRLCGGNSGLNRTEGHDDKTQVKMSKKFILYSYTFSFKLRSIFYCVGEINIYKNL